MTATRWLNVRGGRVPETVSRAFGQSIALEVPVGGAAGLNGLLASSPLLAVNRGAPTLRFAGNAPLVQAGATDRPTEWRALQDAFVECRAARIAETAMLLGRCADTRRRSVEIRAASALLRADSRTRRSHRS